MNHDRTSQSISRDTNYRLRLICAQLQVPIGTFLDALVAYAGSLPPEKLRSLVPLPEAHQDKRRRRDRVPRPPSAADPYSDALAKQLTAEHATTPFTDEKLLEARLIWRRAPPLPGYRPPEFMPAPAVAASLMPQRQPGTRSILSPPLVTPAPAVTEPAQPPERQPIRLFPLRPRVP